MTAKEQNTQSVTMAVEPALSGIADTAEGLPVDGKGPGFISEINFWLSGKTPFAGSDKQVEGELCRQTG